MSRIDRYLFAQQMAFFGFFALILVLIYWLNRAVGLFDQLIGDGQSARVFLEFSLLTLPNVIRLVLPLAAFAGTVYAVNRLWQDGELVAAQAAGMSAFRLARPVALFGLAVAAMLMLLMHLAVPAARAALAARSAEVEANVTAQLLTEGRFMHPTEGVSVFIGTVRPTGELVDVFLADDRSDSVRTTYSAPRAVIALGESGPKLVMFDGLSQILSRESGRLAITEFADFTYDLAGLAGVGLAAPTAEEMTTPALFRADPADLNRTQSTPAAFLAEAHARIAQPLLGLAAPLIGVAVLLLGTYSRFGLWRQVLGAILVLIFVQMLANAGTSAALRSAAAWPAVYAAPLAGLAVAAFLLALADRPRRAGRRRADRRRAAA
jgi:lipopolysaccharide export system permease protein